MKRLLVACIMLAGLPAYAQKIDESKVPAAVKSAFSKNFPGITVSKWEIEKKNYEANFKKNGQKMSAVFDPKGNWMETETALQVGELPANIKSYVADHYKGEKIKEAARIKKANGKTVLEAEVKGLDLLFDEQGNFMESEKE